VVISHGRMLGAGGCDQPDLVAAAAARLQSSGDHERRCRSIKPPAASRLQACKARQQPLAEIAAPLESAIELVRLAEFGANCARRRFGCRRRCRDVIGTHRGSEGGRHCEERSGVLTPLSVTFCCAHRSR